ncbi:helix-turn-helix domain-containing protein [Paracoccus sulfuroxidans]|uniref:helix-turn-helix domain-containing protein n=1 Tax=Paracoccus sulfuroxidans TaxID=384678 RepID=UPI0011A2B45F|nr:helix-turn-helix transcriptional regulator [Paracoccus sulfuroxidans]
MDCGLVHAADNAKLFSIRQANSSLLRQMNWHDTIVHMKEDKPRPYADIAERLKWHRETILNIGRQQDYADSIGVKRSALSLWEAGTHRLSLDGALALRAKYGLSLDFMYEGIDDALPMTLRNAWRDRP